MTIATFESDKIHCIIEEETGTPNVAHRFSVGFKAPVGEKFSFPTMDLTHKQALMWFRRMIKTSKNENITITPSLPKQIIYDPIKPSYYKTTNGHN